MRVEVALWQRHGRRAKHRVAEWQGKRRTGSTMPPQLWGKTLLADRVAVVLGQRLQHCGRCRAAASGCNGYAGGEEALEACIAQ